MAQNNYEVNYDDDRFAQVEADKNAAMSEMENTYDSMIGESDKYYEAQIDASKQWADTQSQLQQDKTDFAIEQIEQQKEQAQKDYTKEQSGAYVDWQKQSNQYGANAEQMASAGMTNTGYSESSQVAMYNQYQNRVATARETFSRAILNYDNAIKEARLQNNSVLAEIAYQALQTELELSLQGFQYKNQLLLDKANKKVEMDNIYYNRYLDVLNQINHENAMAEEIRQYNQNYELSVKQYEESIRQFDKSYEMEVKKFDESIRQFNEEIARLKKKDEREYELQIKELELKKQQAEEQKRQFEAEMKLKRDQLAAQKAAASRSSGGTIKKSSGSTGNNSKVNIDSTEANFDNQSVLNLGYGPISGSYLAELESQGKVKVTQKGNTLYAEKTSAQTQAQNALNKYTIYKLR